MNSLLFCSTIINVLTPTLFSFLFWVSKPKLITHDPKDCPGPLPESRDRETVYFEHTLRVTPWHVHSPWHSVFFNTHTHSLARDPPPFIKIFTSNWRLLKRGLSGLAELATCKQGLTVVANVTVRFPCLDCHEPALLKVQQFTKTTSTFNVRIQRTQDSD